MAPRKTPKRPVRKAKRAEVAATDKQRLHRHVMNAAYLDKPAHLRTRAERSDAGKALRVVCPRESHAGFQPAADRPDPIDLLVQSSEGRIEHLVPIRYGRMLASPFAFFRGAAAIMAADLSQTPCTGIGVQACGDAHLANFGAFATPERRIVFDINDFDETYPAPWEWDLKRLAASFVIASRHNGHKPADGRAAAAAVVEHYRDRMRELAEMPALSAWYSYLDYEKMIETHRGRGAEAPAPQGAGQGAAARCSCRVRQPGACRRRAAAHSRHAAADLPLRRAQGSGLS